MDTKEAFVVEDTAIRFDLLPEVNGYVKAAHDKGVDPWHIVDVLLANVMNVCNHDGIEVSLIMSFPEGPDEYQIMGNEDLCKDVHAMFERAKTVPTH